MNKLSLKELKNLAATHGIVPSGDKRKRSTWETALAEILDKAVDEVLPSVNVIDDKEEETFEILYHKVEEAIALIKKWNKKANRYGLNPIEYTTGKARYIGLGGYEGKFKVVDFTVKSQVIKTKDNWEFAGTIEVLKSGNLINCTDPEIAKKLSTGNFAKKRLTCSHCKIKRYRRKYFIVKDSDSNYKLIGTSCSKEYFGFDIKKAIAFMEFPKRLKEFCEDEYYFEECGHYDIHRVIGYAIAAVETLPWYGSKSQEGEPTYFRVLDNMFPNVKKDRELIITKKQSAKARELVEAWKKLEIGKGNEWDDKKALLAEEGYVSRKQIPLVVGMVYGELKHSDGEKDKANGHFGVIGKRETLSLIIKKTHNIETDYGISQLVIGINAETNQTFKWFNNGTRDWYQDHEDNIFIVKATVKKHESNPKFGDSTVLNRVKPVG